MRFLVTGAAGFIGHRAALALLEAGHEVLGLDNLNPYYDPALKRGRLARLERHGAFEFLELDLSDHQALLALEARDSVDRVVHMAAQAGVRHSVDNPFAYAEANLTGHLAVLEFCRRAAKKPLLIYASSSSVYGVDAESPFREDGDAGRPVSLYAATKRADELMSQAYAKLYDLPQVGLRFFTVYGPWGRPDMAYWSFTDRILRGEPIGVFNQGRMRRDFTYIDDVADILLTIATGEPRFEAGKRPHQLYNIGNNRPVALLDFIREIERATGRDARMVMQPMQPGDVEATCADITKAQSHYGYSPQTPLSEGLPRFVDWFRRHHGLDGAEADARAQAGTETGLAAD